MLGIFEKKENSLQDLELQQAIAELRDQERREDQAIENQAINNSMAISAQLDKSRMNVESPTSPDAVTNPADMYFRFVNPTVPKVEYPTLQRELAPQEFLDAVLKLVTKTFSTSKLNDFGVFYCHTFFDLAKLCTQNGWYASGAEFYSDMYAFLELNKSHEGFMMTTVSSTTVNINREKNKAESENKWK